MIGDIAEALARKRAVDLLRNAQRQIQKAQEAVSADAPEFWEDIRGLRLDAESLIRRLNGEPS